LKLVELEKAKLKVLKNEKQRNVVGKREISFPRLQRSEYLVKGIG
jgi:hypothetical protein